MRTRVTRPPLERSNVDRPGVEEALIGLLVDNILYYAVMVVGFVMAAA